MAIFEIPADRVHRRTVTSRKRGEAIGCNIKRPDRWTKPRHRIQIYDMLSDTSISWPNHEAEDFEVDWRATYQDFFKDLQVYLRHPTRDSRKFTSQALTHPALTCGYKWSASVMTMTDVHRKTCLRKTMTAEGSKKDLRRPYQGIRGRRMRRKIRQWFDTLRLDWGCMDQENDSRRIMHAKRMQKFLPDKCIPTTNSSNHGSES